MTDATARTAIVTGGARGIGAAIAARLAADGMAVGVLGLDEAGARNTAGLIADGGYVSGQVIYAAGGPRS